MSFEIKGISDAVNTLKALSEPSRAKNILNQALMQAALSMVNTAKLICPVDTGQLRNSISAQQTENGADFFTNSDHAEFVEYGTGKFGDKSVAHTTKKYWRYQDANGAWHTTSGMPPTPFMLPAFEIGKNEIAPIITQCIKENLNNG